jgi:membrane-associated phospholipid phosphatase
MLLLSLFILTRFLLYVETREGIIFPDPLLNEIQPVNLTWLIFGIIYFAVFGGLFYLGQNPKRLLITVQSYIVMILFRIIAMYITPFNHPPNMIELNDPLVQVFGTGQLLKNDLFFSGHTATLFLLFLTAEKKWLKNIFMLCTIVVATSVLVQHVHYTVDVFVAPFIAYCSFVLTNKINKKTKYE